MKIRLKQEVAQKVGYDAFADFGITRDKWSTYTKEHEIDLGRLSGDDVDKLEAILRRFDGVRGVPVLLADIEAWTQVLADGAASMRARTVRQFDTLLRQYLLTAPGHRIYKRHDEGSMLCYYANSVEYSPPFRSSNDNRPASVNLRLNYMEFGQLQSTGVHFEEKDCRNIPVAEALAMKGFQIETPYLREMYLSDKERFVEIAGQIGKQYWARGWASDFESSSWVRTAFQLDRFGEAARVLVDVFSENDKNLVSRADRGIDPYFWANVMKYQSYDPNKDDDPVSEDLDLTRHDPEIPIHPWVVIFHLAKHLRMKAHIAGLEEYVYDQELSDKLILPPIQKNLVKLLITTSADVFQDVVRGKSGGSVILLSGPPGTGKTLTAEVYAESEQRPLYSVQCSQLGTDPNTLEKNLMIIFDRARRWNAVMLLDEADVYIHERGNSMNQNAIVGVFLRVLEYQNTVLFLTTNRPQDVDDAIASRCIAKLSYETPSVELAKRIWQMLSLNSGFCIDPTVIDAVVERYPHLSPRDIKMILKLAARMPDAKEAITEEMIVYAQQFKPT